VTALRHRARVLARQLEVRMLIIDEIHSMLAGTFREQRIILNSLRFLANDLRIPLVCLGTQEAKQALMTDQQLADRFDAFELPAWRDDGALAQLLSSYRSLLALREASRPVPSAAAQSPAELDRRGHGAHLSLAGSGRHSGH
jgi:hypothetical protein